MRITVDSEKVATALKKYGEYLQLVVCMEEMAELQQAISKHIRNKADKANELEEIADVYICLETLRQALDFTAEEINAEIEKKQERNARRLYNE